MKEYICKKRCGYCCTLRVRLSWLDILRIVFCAGYRYSDFVERDSSGRKVIKMIGKHCYFENREGRKSSCLVYKYRPRVCRIFPFFNENIKSCEEIKRFNQKFSLSLS